MAAAKPPSERESPNTGDPAVIDVDLEADRVLVSYEDEGVNLVLCARHDRVAAGIERALEGVGESIETAIECYGGEHDY